MSLTGARCHAICKELGMFDTEYSSSHIVVEGGVKFLILKKGNLRISFEGKDGIFREVVLQDVSYIPEMGMNLFSFNKAIDSGGKLLSEGKTMIISKGEKEAFFGTHIKMGSSRPLGSKCKFSEDFPLCCQQKESDESRKIPSNYRASFH